MADEAGDIQERPDALRVPTLLRRTLDVWAANAAGYCGVALLLQSPAILATIALGLPHPQESRGVTALRLAALGLGWALSWVAAGAVAHGVAGALAGKVAPVDGMLLFAVREGPGIMAVSIVQAAVTVLGLLLLVVPGLVAYAALSVAVPAKAADPGLGVGEALRRSRALTAGHRLAIGLALLVLLLALAPMGGVARVLVGFFFEEVGPLGHLAVIQVLSALLGSIWAVAPAVAYDELRRETARAGTPAVR